MDRVVGFQRPLWEALALPEVRPPLADERAHLQVLRHGKKGLRDSVPPEYLCQDSDRQHHRQQRQHGEASGVERSGMHAELFCAFCYNPMF